MSNLVQSINRSAVWRGSLAGYEETCDNVGRRGTNVAGCGEPKGSSLVRLLS